jgi:hypothetical protein
MLSELSIMSKMCMMGKLGMLSMMSTMSMMNTLSTLDMMSMHEHYEHDEHDESALSSLAEHHEHDEHAEHAVVGCIPAIAFRSIDSMNGIPAILCLVGLVSCIRRCVLYRVSTCTRNTIAQSPMLTSYKQTHSAAIHVHRRSARVIRLQACNDLTKTARSVAFSMCNAGIVLYQTLNQTMHVHEPCSGLRERSPTYVHLACLTLICDAQQLYTDAAIRRRS